MAIAARAKRTSHHKKLSGSHHRRSNGYLKTYWPYLPMILIVGLGIVVNNAWSSQAVLGASSNNYNAQSLLNDTNIQRTRDHETALTLNQQLNAAAQAKANDMASRNYWSHDTPDGRTPWSFITAAGYQYKTAGENLAYGFDNADEAITGWMSSPEHKANILNANYQNVGFGVASSSNYQGKGPETIVVAEYAQPATAVSPVNSSEGQSGQVLGDQSQPVSRVQLLTNGQAIWSTIAVSALAGAAITLFIIRHGLRLRRFVIEGESFVLNHPFLEITIVFVGTMGVIFAQVGGVIR